jgi:hypothetical protein
MGVRSLSETRGVDLIMNRPVGAPSPTRAARCSHPGRGTGRGHPARVDPSRVEVAGLASLPNPVVARAAVPDAGARPPPTRPSPPGTHATILWSVSPTQGDHRTVASLRTGRACTRVREARRGPRNGTTPSVVRQPGHGPAAAHGAPACVPMVTPRVRDRSCRANLRPTNARALETAPTLPTRAPQSATTKEPRAVDNEITGRPVRSGRRAQPGRGGGRCRRAPGRAW